MLSVAFYICTSQGNSSLEIFATNFMLNSSISMMFDVSCKNIFLVGKEVFLHGDNNEVHAASLFQTGTT